MGGVGCHYRCLILHMSKLSGRVAFVTGAGRYRGIGRAIALRLAEDGADVVVTGRPRDPASLPDHEKEIGGHEEEVSEASTQEDKSSFESVEDHEKELDSLEESVPVPPNDDKNVSLQTSI